MPRSTVLVLYDISDDKLRGKIIDACRDQGLLPAQFSVYAGELSVSRRRELTDGLSLLMQDQSGHVVVLPVDRDCREAIVSIGTPQVGALNFWKPVSHVL